MASACEFRAPNGKPSILFRRLQRELGSEQAALLWEKTKTPAWQEKHGIGIIRETTAQPMAAPTSVMTSVDAMPAGSKTVLYPEQFNLSYRDYNQFKETIVPAVRSVHPNALIAFRAGNKSHTQAFIEDGYIGNPFNWKDESGTREEQGKSATAKFANWLLTGDAQGNKAATKEYHAALTGAMRTGTLKGRPILYYQSKGYSTHADVIDYFINVHKWEPVTAQSNKPALDKLEARLSQMMNRGVTRDTPITPGMVIRYQPPGTAQAAAFIVRRINEAGKLELIRAVKREDGGWNYELPQETPAADHPGIQKISQYYTFHAGEGSAVSQYALTGTGKIFNLKTGVTYAEDSEAYKQLRELADSELLFELLETEAELAHYTEVLGELTQPGGILFDVPKTKAWIAENLYDKMDPITRLFGAQQQGLQADIQPINIFYSSGKDGFNQLSNLHPREVTINGVPYGSVEQAYQHIKAVQAGQAELAAQIIALEGTTNGWDAKKIGSQVTRAMTAEQSEAWKAESYRLMKYLISQALNQNPEMRALLKATGIAPLTHINPQKKSSVDFWTEAFPQILMELRADVVATKASSKDTFMQSGGADGADAVFTLNALRVGLSRENMNQWREPGQYTVDSDQLKAIGITAKALDQQTYMEGKAMADRIDELLKRNPKRGKAHYRYRNYGQVKYADSVFAVSKGMGQDGHWSDRGTVYAIYGAVLDGKPVHVFDQEQGKWFTWNNNTREWEQEQTPRLTGNFAGVGTREPNAAAIKAIEELFNLSFPVLPPVPMDPNGEPNAAEVLRREAPGKTAGIATDGQGKHLPTLDVDAFNSILGPDAWMETSMTLDIVGPEGRGSVTVSSETRALMVMLAQSGDMSTANGLYVAYEDALYAANEENSLEEIREMFSEHGLSTEQQAALEYEILRTRFMNDEKFRQALVNSGNAVITSTKHPLRAQWLTEMRNYLINGNMEASMSSITADRLGKALTVTLKAGREFTLDLGKLKSAEDLLKSEVRNILMDGTPKTKQELVKEIRLRIERRLAMYALLQRKVSRGETLVKNEPQALRALRESGLTPADVVAALQELGEPAQGKAGHTSNPTVLDILIDRTVFDEYADELGLTRSKRDGEDETSLNVSERGQLREANFDEDVFSMAPHKTPSLRLKSLLSSIPSYRLSIADYKSVSFSVPSKQLRTGILGFLNGTNPGAANAVLNDKPAILIIKRKGDHDKIGLNSPHSAGRFNLDGQETVVKYRQPVVFVSSNDPAAANLKKAMVDSNIIPSVNSPVPIGEELYVYEITEKYTGTQQIARQVISSYGSPKYTNYEMLYNRIVQVLHNQRNLVWRKSSPLQDATSAYELMSAHPDPSIREAARVIDNAGKKDAKHINEFINVMKLTQNNEFRILLDRTAAGMNVHVVRGDRSSMKSNVIYRWQQRQLTSSAFYIVNNERVFNVEALQQLKLELMSINQMDTESRVPALKEFANRVFEFFGVDFTPAMIEAMFNPDEYRELTSRSSFRRDVINIGGFDKKGRPMGLLSALVHDKNVFEGGEGTTVSLLADLYMKYDQQSFAQAYLNNEGKRVWPHGLGNHVSKTVSEWNTGIVGEAFKTNGVVTDRFHTLNPWITAEQKLQQLKSTTLGFDGGIASRQSSQEGKGRPSMEFGELEMVTLSGFLHGGANSVLHFGFTNSDKKNVNTFHQKFDRAANSYVVRGTHAIYDMMMVTASMEINRMANSTKPSERHFFLLPQLNRDGLMEYVRELAIPESYVDLLYDKEGRFRLVDIWQSTNPAHSREASNLIALLKQKILPVIFKDMKNRQRASWRTNQILKPAYVPATATTVRPGWEFQSSANELRSGAASVIVTFTPVVPGEDASGMFWYVDKSGDRVLLRKTKSTNDIVAVKDMPLDKIQKMLEKMGRPSDVESAQQFQNDAVTMAITITAVEVVEEKLTMDDNSHAFYERLLSSANRATSELEIVEAILDDYVAATFEFNTQVLTLLAGDPALFSSKFKGNTAQGVDLVMREYNKRLAGLVAPGYMGAWPPGSTFKALTLADPDVYAEEIINAGLAQQGTKYDTIADAQEGVTVREWLDNQFYFGNINQSLYEEMLKEIPSDPGAYFEFTKPEHKALIRQPEKYVYYGKQQIGGVTYIDYVKSSTIVLYPPDLGTGLNEVRALMEKNGIQRVHFKSARKASVPLTPLKLFTDGEKVQEVSMDDIAAATSTLSRDSQMVQQFVPYDATSREIYIVTQAHKNIIDSIAFRLGQPVETPWSKQSLTGQDIVAKLDTLVNNMLNVQTTEQLDNLPGASAILQRVKESAEQTGGVPIAARIALHHHTPVMDDFGKSHMVRTVPFLMNPAIDRLQSMLLNLANKPLRLYLPGASFVQSTSAGTAITDNGKYPTGITFIEGFNPTQRLKSEVLITSDGARVVNGQIIVPFSFLDHNNKKLHIKDFTKTITLDDGITRTVLDTDKLPKQLLRKIGMRIPNQKHSSMLALEIVGFLSEGAGKQVIVPADITRQMGADFDVDKLFTYQYNYVYDPIAGVLKVDGSTDMKRWQNEYVEMFETVLLAPEMYSEVMGSVDMPDIKEAQKKYKVDSLKASQFERNYMNSDYAEQRNGKDLIGIFAKLKTFEPVIQLNPLPLVRTAKDPETGALVSSAVNTGTDGYASFRIFNNQKTGKALNYTHIGGMANAVNPQGVTRSRGDVINMLLSASVDYSKQRELDFLSINLKTAPAITALIALQDMQAEESLNIDRIVLFLKQPIIQELLSRQSVYGTYMSGNKTEAQIAEELLREYFGLRIEDAQEAADRMSREDYADVAIEDNKYESMRRSGKLDSKEQMYVLLQYLQLIELGKSLQSVQSHADIDVNGLGKDVVQAYIKLSNTVKELANGVPPGMGVQDTVALLFKPGVSVPGPDIFKDENNMKGNLEHARQILEMYKDDLSTKGAYLYHALRLYLGIIPDIIDLRYVDNTIKQVALRLEPAGGPASLALIAGTPLSAASERLVSDVFSFYRSSASYVDLLAENIDETRLWLTRPELETRFTQLMSSPAYSNNIFFRNLSVVDAERRKANDPVMFRYRSKIVDDATEKDVYAAFVEIIAEPATGKEDVHAEAREFVMQVLHQHIVFGGLGQNSGLLKLAHPALLEAIGLGKYLRNANSFEQLSTNQGRMSNFVSQFIRHYPEHAARAPFRTATQKLDDGTRMAKVSFVTNERTEEYLSLSIDNKTYLYHRSGSNGQLQEYTQIPVLGKNGFMEAGAAVSIFQGNRPTFNPAGLPATATGIVPVTLHTQPVLTPSSFSDILQSVVRENPDNGVELLLNAMEESENADLKAFASFAKSMPEVAIYGFNSNPGQGNLALYDNNSMTMSFDVPAMQALNVSFPNNFRYEPAYIFAHEYTHGLVMQRYAAFLNKESSTAHRNAIVESMLAMRDWVEQNMDKSNPLYTFYTGVNPDGTIQQYEDGSPIARPLNNIHEFLAHILGDAEFMRLANRVKLPASAAYANRTVWEQIADFISAVFKDLAENLGIVLDKEAVLSNVLSIFSQAHMPISNGWTQQPYKHEGIRYLVTLDSSGSAVGVWPTEAQELWKAYTPSDRARIAERVIAAWTKEQEAEEQSGIDDTLDGDQDVFGYPKMPRYNLDADHMLNESQREALDTMDEFFSRLFFENRSLDSIPNEYKSWLLSGQGGAGKTTIVRKLVQALVEKGLPSGAVVYLGPTHRANNELSKALNGKIRPITMAKASGKFLDNSDLTAPTSVVDVGVDSDKNPLKRSMLVIIDESSMLDPEELAKIQDIAANAAFLYVGDIAQLGPVAPSSGPQSAEVKFKSSFSWPMLTLPTTGNVSFLDTNMRVQNPDLMVPISAMRDQVMEMIQNGMMMLENGIPPAPGLSREPLFTVGQNSEHVKYYDNPAQFLAKAVAAFNENQEIGDVQILTYTKAATDKYNIEVRRALLGVGPEVLLTPFDLIVQQSPGILLDDSDPDFEEAHNAIKGIGMSKAYGYNSMRMQVEEVLPQEWRAFPSEYIEAGMKKVQYFNIPVLPYIARTEASPLNIKGHLPLTSYDATIHFEAIRSFFLALSPKSGMEMVPLPAVMRTAAMVEAMSANGIAVEDGAVRANPVSRRFFNLVGSLARQNVIKHNFAGNIHKVQGGRVKKAFVVEEEIRNVQARDASKRNDLDLAKALYTAFSRASEELHIFHRQYKVMPQAPLAMAMSIHSAMSGTVAVTQQNASPAQDRQLNLLATEAPTPMAIFGKKVNRTGAVVSKVPDTQHERLLEKLLSAKRALAESIASDAAAKPGLATGENIGRRNQLIRLENDIIALQNNKSMDLSAVAPIMASQLKWATSVLNRKELGNLSLYDTMRAYELVSIWADYMNVVEPTIVPEVGSNSAQTISQELEFAETVVDSNGTMKSMLDMIGEASVLQKGLLSKLARMLAQRAGNRAQVANLDQSKLNTFRYVAANFTLDLANSSNELLAYAAYTVERKQIERDADMVTLLKRIEALKVRQKSLESTFGTTMWSLVTGDWYTDGKGNALQDWGLIRQESGEYIREIRRIYDTWQKAMRSASKPGFVTNVALTAAKNYHAEMNKASVYINPSRIFDFTVPIIQPHPTDPSISVISFARKPQAELDAYIAELNQEALYDVEPLIEQAFDKAQQYIDDVNGASASIQQTLAGLGYRPGVPGYDEQYNEELGRFVAQYNPSFWFDSNDVGPTDGIKVTPELLEQIELGRAPGKQDMYLVKFPRSSKKNSAGDMAYYDSKYYDYTIKSETDPKYAQLMAWLDDYKKELRFLSSLYPPEFGVNRIDAALPVIPEAIARIPKGNIIDWIMNTAQRAVDDFSAQDGLAFRSLTMAVPKMFTSVKDGMAMSDPTANYSIQLDRILEIYGQAALHFHHMNAVQDQVMAADLVLRNQELGNDTAKQNGIAAWEFMLAKKVFKEPNELQQGGAAFRFDGTRASLAAGKQIAAMEKEIEDLEEAHDEVINDHAIPFFDRWMKGRELKTQLAAKQKELLELKAQFPNRRLYASKIADKAIALTQLKAFGWNPISGIVNFAMAYSTAYAYGAGKDEFTTSTLQSVMKKMGASMLSFAATPEHIAFRKKALAFLKLSNLHGKLKDSGMNASNLAEYERWFEKHIMANPFVFMAMGDEVMKVAILTAIAHDTEVTTLDGKTMKLWDGLSEDGTWDADKHGELPGFGNEVNGLQNWQGLSKIVQKAQGALQPILGETDSRTAILAKKHWIGRLIGQFRLSWIPEGLRYRFGNQQEYNYKLGRRHKGKYTTAMDIGLLGHFAIMFRTLLPGSIDSVLEGYTVAQRETADSKGRPTGSRPRIPLNQSSVDVANTYRNIVSFRILLATTAMMYGIVAGMKYALDDDDEDDMQTKRFMLLTYNLFARQYQDMVFYSNPGEAASLLRGIIPAMGLSKDFLKWAYQAHVRMVNDDITLEEYLLRFARNGIILPHLSGATKILTYMDRDILSY